MDSKKTFIMIFCTYVGFTAFHAQELGFRTILIDDCSRGITNENINNTFDKIKSQYGCVVQSSEVKPFNVLYEKTINCLGQGNGSRP